MCDDGSRPRDSARVTPRSHRSRGCLTAIGDLVEDVVVWTSGPPVPGTDNPSVIHRTPGGSAANVAALAAGAVPARFVGRVGDDRLGRELVDSLRADGVQVIAQHAGRTGSVVVLVHADGERTMFPDRGAAVLLDHVDPDHLRGTAALHVPAYGLVVEPMATVIREAMAYVRRQGALVSIDVSATTLVEAVGARAFRAMVRELGPDVVFANGDESAALDLDELEPWPGSVFVVKHGPKPAVVRGHGIEPTVVPAPVVDDVRDTTGAGDAFAAGYLAATMSGADPVAACEAGHGLAAEILRTPGARRSG